MCKQSLPKQSGIFTDRVNGELEGVSKGTRLNTSKTAIFNQFRPQKSRSSETAKLSHVIIS